MVAGLLPARSPGWGGVGRRAWLGSTRAGGSSGGRIWLGGRPEALNELIGDGPGMPIGSGKAEVNEGVPPDFEVLKEFIGEGRGITRRGGSKSDIKPAPLTGDGLVIRSWMNCASLLAPDGVDCEPSLGTPLDVREDGCCFGSTRGGAPARYKVGSRAIRPGTASSISMNRPARSLAWSRRSRVRRSTQQARHHTSAPVTAYVTASTRSIWVDVELSRLVSLGGFHTTFLSTTYPSTDLSHVVARPRQHWSSPQQVSGGPNW